jgi:hypothetical protein
MKKWMQKLSLLVLLFTISQFSFGQQNITIKGNVTDGKLAVEFVDVILKKVSDSTKVANYAVTDALGNFSLENVASGDYQLQVKLIGSKTFSQKIKVENSSISMSPIVLQSDTNLLNAVVVNSQKKQIQKTDQGFIFNTASNISQSGGTAVDMLKSIPTLAVDAEGGITLRGKSPMILINGKNSAITNMDQIAASSIESIEIISNPTSKYDANAESGIINIKLKKTIKMA